MAIYEPKYFGQGNKIFYYKCIMYNYFFLYSVVAHDEENFNLVE